MKYLTMIAFLTGMAVAMTSCCYTRPSCAPVVVSRQVPSAVPLLPTYYPRCSPEYCPQHLPYVIRGETLNPTLPPSGPCHPCY